MSLYYRRDEYSEDGNFTDRVGFEAMPRRATAMMAVLAVVIHCVLGCCARCLNASVHHDHSDPCQANCICCDHHHHDAGIEFCCQPASNSIETEFSSEAAPQPDHECLGCGTAKCAFILSESACDGLTDALLLPAELCWSAMEYPSIDCDLQQYPPRFSERTTRHITPKLRLHLSLAVLTL
ncbi:hypothetical protein C5Y96_00560 [Blastopirellula marina]|uniref:Uncharacterized protein n=1 Tax=Blastopirellula marina TaxID=124 RepID=A0A2S8GAD4_9BACT|nr:MULTISPECIES: hypothetical protein [Pirellulaceae]PQO41241.1 hypothetical protein C5Y96_00560 [Blastopirellula marina]RCS56265.1 hypothetical protein DTL36_00560 [Bremerella cremea]